MNEHAHDPLARAAARGMSVAYHAAIDPRRMAIVSPAGRRSFGELNARVNQQARALRAAGLTPGDGIALLVANRPEFVETHQAALRIGARVTPINWHLGPDEVAYIVDDSEAIAFVAEAAFEPAAASAARRATRLRLRLAVGGEIDGFAAYDAVLARHPDGDLEDPILGSSMLYTSGTTGRPKGVFRKPSATGTAMLAYLRESAAFRPGTDSVLITGPLYHAAPLGTQLIALTRGVGSVLMGKWDAEETLALIARHRITHTHLVATMFQRLLDLPDEVKTRYDITSLRWVSHGAAPTPVHVKRRMIAWWGPILYEYYAATEGGPSSSTRRNGCAGPGPSDAASAGGQSESSTRRATRCPSAGPATSTSPFRRRGASSISRPPRRPPPPIAATSTRSATSATWTRTATSSSPVAAPRPSSPGGQHLPPGGGRRAQSPSGRLRRLYHRGAGRGVG
jgi:acyl-CoA synthetase (AMP-forming)/AMP-acid ligase II